MSRALRSPINGSAASSSAEARFGSIRSASSPALAGVIGCGSETYIGFSQYRTATYAARRSTNPISTPRCLAVHGSAIAGIGRVAIRRADRGQKHRPADRGKFVEHRADLKEIARVKARRRHAGFQLEPERFEVYSGLRDHLGIEHRRNAAGSLGVIFA